MGELLILQQGEGLHMKFSWHKAAITDRRRNEMIIGRKVRPQKEADCVENILKIIKRRDPHGEKAMTRLRKVYSQF